MKRIIFSDVHLGSPDRLYYREFERFLRYECTKYDEIIILGDLFELWTSTSEKILHFEQSTIKLLKWLDSNYKVIFIPGNHDFMYHDVMEFNNVKYPHYRFSAGGRGFYITHGHLQSYESKMKCYKIFNWIMNIGIFAKLLNHIFSTPKQELIERIFKWMKGDKQEVTVNALRKASMDIPGYVIMGHTHKCEVRNMYANTGNWLSNMDYITINEKGNVKKHTYDCK